MVIYEKDIQKKVLRALKNLNGSSRVDAIASYTGFTKKSCYGALDGLKKRSLITKTSIVTKAKFRVPPYQNVTYHLNPKRMNKINQQISLIEEDDY